MCTYLSLFKFQEGETVLISAARDGHLEVVRTLLSKYADIEASDCVSVCVFFFLSFPFLNFNVALLNFYVALLSLC